MNRYRCLTVVVAVAALLCAATANTMINPNFTPIDLVKQAELIVSVDLKQGASRDEYSATIREVLKGKTELKALRLDLSKGKNADALRELALAARPALFFVGEFAEEKGGQGGEAPQRRGFLHASGRWAEFSGGQAGLWGLNGIDDKSQGVWAGGTDMLRRCVDYILQDDNPEVPVKDGVAWSNNPQKIATLSGKIRAVRPIDLGGDGKLLLFVAPTRAIACWPATPRPGNSRNVTLARRLEAKSQAFAWGDFAGHGRLDLISFDGQTFALHAQQADGTFQARPLELPGELAGGCIGLAALDCGTKGRSGLLVSSNSWPVLVSFDTAGKPSAAPLAAPGIDLKKLGQAGPCLVADFAGNGVADVLAPLAAGSVLFRGLAPGKFAPGIACAVQFGAGPSAACVADFDGDGRLDVLCAGSDGVGLWQNEGGGKFSETLRLSGEIEYISKPGGVECQVGNVNNDGRQDALIAYAAMSPQIFFNRGFRSFGHADTLDLGERHLLAENQGQQSACLGDFDGDGAQDMVLALNDGEIWAFFRENDDHEARSVVAALPVAGQFKGPVTVRGWMGKRCLGAWNVLPGVSQAFFGRMDAGPVTLKWRLPGGKEQQREVVVEKETARVEIK